MANPSPITSAIETFILNKREFYTTETFKKSFKNEYQGLSQTLLGRKSYRYRAKMNVKREDYYFETDIIGHFYISKNGRGL